MIFCLSDDRVVVGVVEETDFFTWAGSGEISTGGICTASFAPDGGHSDGNWSGFQCLDIQRGAVDRAIIEMALVDEATGTLVGAGTLLDDETGVRAWTGHDLAGHFAAETGSAELICGETALPLN